MAIIDFATQQTIKKISANNQTKYADMLNEVENNELRELIGIALLQDLQNNPETDANKDLIEGCSFVNCDNNTISHKGIRFVLAYLFHSSYLGQSFVADTFTGMVQKTRTDATQLSEGQIKRLQETDRKIALSEFEIIEQFLNINRDLYPLWNKCVTSKIYTPKFYGIKKTKSNGNNSSQLNFIQL